MKKSKKNEKDLIIEENLEFVIDAIEEVEVDEAEGDGGEKTKFLKLGGIVQQGNSKNGNNRVYPTEILVREVKKNQSRIKSGLMLGKVYHPSFFEPGGPSGVKDVSHRMTKLEMDGDFVRGELLVFNTESGTDVGAIYEGGGKVGISSRGRGGMTFQEKVKIGGKSFKDVYVIDDNYELGTFDLVLSPSVKRAIVKKVKSEETEGSNEGNSVEEVTQGGTEEMTLEEFKAKYPELYNTIHDAAVKEGKASASIELKAEHQVDTKNIKDEAKEELDGVKAELSEEKSKVESLTKENTDLKEAVSKIEAEKLSADIKEAVVKAVKEAGKRDYFEDKDIEDICKVVEKIEDVKEEVTARVGVIDRAISKYKTKNTTEESGSISIDTSESGETTDKTENDKAYAQSQRAAAGL
jgi:hypothetical protein